MNNYETIIEQNEKLIKKLKNLQKTLNHNFGIVFSFNNYTINDIQNEEFDEELEKKYIENQHHFCMSNDLFIDKDIESKIAKVKINLNDISFEMFVYNSSDYVSNAIIKYGYWEKSPTDNIINCLKYYSKRKNLSKKEITILDIGANVGWYTFYLAKSGYELYSFEISRINSYILKKNFCLNENKKVTIINKGISIDKENEKCILHHPSDNIGNAVILCDQNMNNGINNKKLNEEVEFTKLSNYYNFLSKKNIALIKMDVEGSEGDVINSGIEFINKYHVPFILIEFNDDYLNMQGTKPKKLLELLEKNGYLFSNDNFLSKLYLSIEEVLKLRSTNLYVIYSKFVS